MNELLEKALIYQEENKFDASEKCFLKALDEYPNDKEILVYSAIFFFEKGEYEKALDLFVQSYNHPDQNQNTKEDLLNHILVAYYQPCEEAFRKNYDNNVHALLAYEHNLISSFVDFDELSYLCIPRNDLEYYILDKNAKKIKERVIMDKAVTTYTAISINDCVIATNIFDIMQLQSLAKQTKDPLWINNIKIPIYIVWPDDAKMQQYLQLVNYEIIIALNRVVFFADFNEKSGIRAFLEDHQAYVPNKAIGDNQYLQKVQDLVSQVKTMRQQDITQKETMINQLALKYDKKYYKNLFSSSYDNLRILFYTSRFTQVVQYWTRDFMRACQELGIQCLMVIDKSDIHQATSSELVNKIAEFRPNIIFRINFFKSDFEVIPSNIMFINWMQDPAYQLSSYKHAKQFGWNDFSLTYTRNWRAQMIETGYDSSRIEVQTVPVDENIFYARDMSQEEREFYKSDISFPGNYQRPEKHLANLIVKYTADEISVDLKAGISDLLISTYEILRSKMNNSELIYSAEQCETIIRELAALLEIDIELNVIKQMGQEFFHPVCYNLQRKITLKWLIDYGFQVKLWGRGWDTDPDFKANAMGLLNHGEELAKMYSCAKIVPGAFIEYTAHFRSWESTSCGALGMVRYIPEELDLVNIREYFTEDEHFVFYRDKQDLIEKVAYYLSHEDERKRIVENGRQKVLQTLTYSSAARKCLQLIKENMQRR